MTSSGSNFYVMGANGLVSKARAATRDRVRRGLAETMASLSKPRTIVNYMKDRVAAVRDRDGQEVVDSAKSPLADMMETVYFTENALLATRRQMDDLMREREQLKVENDQLRQELITIKEGSSSVCCRQLAFVLKDRAHLQLVNNQLRKELLNTMDELVSSLAEANRAQKKLAELEKRMNPRYSKADDILKSKVYTGGVFPFADDTDSKNLLEAPTSEVQVDFTKKTSTYRKSLESQEESQEY